MPKTMTSILIINVDSTPMLGAEKYLPEPAMGNMKPESPDYAVKYKEKRNRQLQDLQNHAFLSKPLSIQYLLAKGDGVGFTDGTSGRCDTVKDFFEAIDALRGTVSFGAGDGIICGPHPTTHMRILINTALRYRIQIPFWATAARRFNPWLFISTASEGEYPVPWVALDRKAEGPVPDTFSLLKAVGHAILNPSVKE